MKKPTKISNTSAYFLGSYLQVFGLCLVGGTNILRSESDLFSVLNDRLVFRKKADDSYELALHVVVQRSEAIFVSTFLVILGSE